MVEGPAGVCTVVVAEVEGAVELVAAAGLFISVVPVLGAVVTVVVVEPGAGIVAGAG